MLDQSWEVRRAIVEHAPLKHPSIRGMLMLPQDELTALREEQLRRLEASGVKPMVALAYQTAFPLLAEHEALTTFCSRMGDPSWRRMLPEVTTPGEAVRLAASEFPLMTRVMQRELLDLLVPLAS